MSRVRIPPRPRRLLGDFGPFAVSQLNMPHGIDVRMQNGEEPRMLLCASWRRGGMKTYRMKTFTSCHFPCMQNCVKQSSDVRLSSRVIFLHIEALFQGEPNRYLNSGCFKHCGTLP